MIDQLGVNPPADIASGRIAEVRSRSVSCNCMTRTSQQECRGILEFLNSDREKRTKSIRISMLFVLFLLAAFAIKGKMWIYLNFFLCPFYDFVDVQ